MTRQGRPSNSIRLGRQFRRRGDFSAEAEKRTGHKLRDERDRV
jgi:hypothetical protein